MMLGATLLLIPINEDRSLKREGDSSSFIHVRFVMLMEASRNG